MGTLSTSAVSKLPRPCLEGKCPGHSYKEGRCKPHYLKAQAVRNAQPKRSAYADPILKRWKAAMLPGGICVTCGSRVDLTADHVLPLDNGGTNAPSNLQVLCRSCNSSKGNR